MTILMTDREWREYAQFHEGCDLLEAIRRYKAGTLKSLDMKQALDRHPGIAMITPAKRKHAQHMTIGQLRAQLAALTPGYDDCPVDTEGCDCVGPCGGLERAVFSGETCFILTRNERGDATHRCCVCGAPAVTAFDNDEFCAAHADADPRGIAERERLGDG